MLSDDDCQCWLWSDPHVETCDGTTADFNPMPEAVHSLASGEGVTLQSYHCRSTDDAPDYYPCGASAAVAFAGTFTDWAGASHTIVFIGEKVLVDGRSPSACATTGSRVVAVGTAVRRAKLNVVDPVGLRRQEDDGRVRDLLRARRRG